MDLSGIEGMDGDAPRARLALLLAHFSGLPDGREPQRICTGSTRCCRS